jgi:mRNA interferase RelE/StbE
MALSSPYAGYRILISKKAHKSIQGVPKAERVTIAAKIDLLTSEYYDSLDIKKLQEYKNLYRIRLGNYRIVYKPLPAQKTILIVIVAHRKEVYELLRNLSLLA